MQLSKRCEYALRALIDIGIAHEVGRKLLPIAELSKHEHIPLQFLEQILLQLKAAGYLESKRGKGGGYALKKPLQLVHIGDVVREIDGPLAPIRCASVTAYERCSCPDEEHCGLRMLMVDVRNSTAGILDRHTLQDVVNDTLRVLKRDRLPAPFKG
jgi:Rrf2 family protein